MKLIRKLFSVDTLLLVVSLLLLFISVRTLITGRANLNDLILHTGVVEWKSELTAPTQNEDYTAIRIRLEGDTAWYTASRYAKYINDNIVLGDTVQLYTKALGKWGNWVSDELGDHVWTSKNPQEIFHLVATKNNDIIISYIDNQQYAKKMMWFLLVMSFVLMGWYILRKLRKNPSTGSVEINL